MHVHNAASESQALYSPLPHLAKVTLVEAWWKLGPNTAHIASANRKQQQTRPSVEGFRGRPKANIVILHHLIAMTSECTGEHSYLNDSYVKDMVERIAHFYELHEVPKFAI